jgi:hypothetical protein
MQDLGMKVVALSKRVSKLERKLELSPLTLQTSYTPDYYNLLVKRVTFLNKRVTRLERTVGLATDAKTPSNALLKNIAMKINALCQRIIKLEQVV